MLCSRINSVRLQRPRTLFWNKRIQTSHRCRVVLRDTCNNLQETSHLRAKLVKLKGFVLCYLTVILRGRAGYELIYITNEAVGRVGYYQLISGKSEKNNCFSKFSSNSLDFFGWNLLKSWHFLLYRRRRVKIFPDLQNFSTRNSPSVFPYLVKLNDNGSYHGLREPIRKLDNHYPKL